MSKQYVVVVIVLAVLALAYPLIELTNVIVRWGLMGQLWPGKEYLFVLEIVGMWVISISCLTLIGIILGRHRQ